MPVKAPRHLGRLLALVRLYGRKEVLVAIGQALEYQTYDAAYVEALILQQRRRRDLPSPIPLRPKRNATDRRHSPGRARSGPQYPYRLFGFLQRQGTPIMTSPRDEGLFCIW